jgi:hypothetical protein
MTDYNPLFYSNRTDANPIIRIHDGFCPTFRTITEAIASGAMTLAASSEHVRNCRICQGYLADAAAAPVKPVDEIDDELAL